jgi:hypothetical protein
VPRGPKDFYVEGDILTLLSGLTDLTERLEMLDCKKQEVKELCYVM